MLGDAIFKKVIFSSTEYSLRFIADAMSISLTMQCCLLG